GETTFLQEPPMNLAPRRVLSACLLVLAGVCALAYSAAATPVSIDMTNLTAIQPYALDKDSGEDAAYLLVSGVANGKDVSDRVPKDGTWTLAPKKPVDGSKTPFTIWKGDLADGEFAFITVTLMQG